MSKKKYNASGYVTVTYSVDQEIEADNEGEAHELLNWRDGYEKVNDYDVYIQLMSDKNE
jgi:hypothetical protein